MQNKNKIKKIKKKHEKCSDQLEISSDYNVEF